MDFSGSSERGKKTSQNVETNKNKQTCWQTKLQCFHPDTQKKCCFLFFFTQSALHIQHWQEKWRRQSRKAFAVFMPLRLPFPHPRSCGYGRSERPLKRCAMPELFTLLLCTNVHDLILPTPTHQKKADCNARVSINNLHDGNEKIIKIRNRPRRFNNPWTQCKQLFFLEVNFFSLFQRVNVDKNKGQKCTIRYENNFKLISLAFTDLFCIWIFFFSDWQVDDL